VARMSIGSGPRATQLAGDLSLSGSLGHRDEGEKLALQQPLFLNSPVLSVFAYILSTGTRTEQQLQKRVITNE